MAALATSGTAHAVYQDPTGFGQALIYPYYTVQTAGGNSFNTYLSVVNTSTRAKAAKVRFREGKNSRSVLEFNLYLSPNDVWTAALGPADASPSSPAVIVTADKSCTAPPIPSAGQAFRNYAYVGAQGDGGPNTLDRTREGYFEIIEMANLTGSVATAVTHTASGSPANCAAVQPDVFSAANAGPFLQPPSGGLSGTYTLINVANGLNFGGNATALSQFSGVPLFTDLGDAGTNLGAANPPIATVVAGSIPGASGSATTLYTATYANGRDAVSAAMMRTSLINEYALDVATRSATDWVVTLPTRHLFVGVGPGFATAPFGSNFTTTGSCEPVTVTIFNREERSTTQGGDCGFICPPPPAVPSLCWAAGVVSINNGATASSIFGSTNLTPISTGGLENGMARLAFTGTAATITGLTSLAGTGYVRNLDTGATVSNATVNFRGLPAIGFMARTLNNGALSCTTFGGTAGTCAGSYGAAFDHKYSVIAAPTP